MNFTPVSLSVMFFENVKFHAVCNLCSSLAIWWVGADKNVPTIQQLLLFTWNFVTDLLAETSHERKWIGHPQNHQIYQNSPSAWSFRYCANRCVWDDISVLAWQKSTWQTLILCPFLIFFISFFEFVIYWAFSPHLLCDLLLAYERNWRMLSF